MNSYMTNYGFYKLMVLVDMDGKVAAVNSTDNLDLIDLVNFVWKVKGLLLGGVLLGAIVGMAWGYLSIKKIAVSTSYEIVLEEDGSQHFTTLDFANRLSIISDMMSYPRFSELFFDGLQKAIPKTSNAAESVSKENPESRTAELISMKSLQVADLGPTSIAAFKRDRGFLISLSLPMKVKPEDLEGPLVDALNQVIEDFNSDSEKKYSSKEEKLREAQLVLNSIRTRAYSLYYRLLKEAKFHQISIAEIGKNEKVNDSLNFDQVDSIIRLISQLEVLAPRVASDAKVDLATLQIEYSHTAQLISYLKASGLKVGLLMNFAKEVLKIKRVVN